MKNRNTGLTVMALRLFALVLLIVFLLAGTASADLVDNGDGTVTDTVTSLMWQQASMDLDNDGTADTMTWEQALYESETLTFAGYSDWRLPSINELRTIIDYSRHSPAINTILFPDTVLYYWSSTTLADITWYDDRAWLVNFSYYGHVYPSPKLSGVHVRAVRGGQVSVIPTTIPVADAGPDQPVIQVGSTVQLDGTQSYDPEGDPIAYLWAFTSKAGGSNATLSDPTSPTPTFQVDIHGNYIIELVVSDATSSSEPDTVTVSFENVAPIANAGTNHTVVQGETVCFDGSGSSDGNFDPLTYFWNIISLPDGSLAFLDDPTAITPCLTTDFAGNYDVSLIVNDGFVDSEPSTANVFAVAYLDATTESLQGTTTVINNIDLDDLKNKGMQNALTSKINAALELVDQGSYTEACDKLQNDILGKTDGCATSGEPDRNDWIQDCASQDQVYPLIIEIIGYLESI